MRFILGLAILVIASCGLSACFHHHQKQVVVEPIAPPFK